MEPLRMSTSSRPEAFSRRDFLQMAGIAGVSWLTPLGHLLARQAEQTRQPARSVILLWLAGGPSQLETFDPHPDSRIAGGTRAIATAAKEIQLAAGLEGLAEQMPSVALLRALVSKEGDHERGTYYMKTGYRPDPTVVHPSIGAICCHELPVGTTDIPRHISILPDQWPSRGGYLGAEFDAFKVGDPAGKLPDVSSPVPAARAERRLADLPIVEQTFARGRRQPVAATMHQATLQRARAMMASDQLAAFEVGREPIAIQKAYGATPFGRACLAARRLIEVGVRCVEVTLGGWDSHTNNHAIQRERVGILDPALSTLIADLKSRELLDRTIVLCLGEFGRTPTINPAGGRDHWTNGFSMALAGGGIRGGQALGQTDPKGVQDPVGQVTIGDVYATVLTALGLDCAKELMSPVKRPLKLSQGQPIEALL